MKSPLVKRLEERFTNIAGPLPFNLFTSDKGQPILYETIQNVSRTGLGLIMPFYVDPSSYVETDWSQARLSLKVVHCTFIPETQKFYCGLRLAAYSAKIDLVEIIFLANKLVTDTTKP